MAATARKIWTDAEIRDTIAFGKDPWWVVRAIEAIFERQTEDEQRTESTNLNNKVGFGAADARLMSGFAKQIKEWRDGKSNYAFPLSPRQIAKARERMPKYAGQLAGIANAKLAAQRAEEGGG